MPADHQSSIIDHRFPESHAERPEGAEAAEKRPMRVKPGPESSIQHPGSSREPSSLRHWTFSVRHSTFLLPHPNTHHRPPNTAPLLSATSASSAVNPLAPSLEPLLFTSTFGVRYSLFDILHSLLTSPASPRYNLPDHGDSDSAPGLGNSRTGIGAPTVQHQGAASVPQARPAAWRP
jgi:hypothetical protein